MVPMMGTDKPALLDVVLHEAEAERFLDAMGEAETRLISAASVLEAGTFIESRRDPRARDALIAYPDLELEPVTAERACIGHLAYRSYGKRHHPASLNFVNCFT